MRVQRIRPTWSDAWLAAAYATPHDHTRFGRGHHERVEATIALARDNIIVLGEPMRIADLSCGNGAIARGIAPHSCESELHLGEIGFLPAELDAVKYCGLLEETVNLIPDVDVFICSETLEHLDDPQHSLTKIRDRAEQLVLSTPLEQWDDSNAEHYWAWDREFVEHLMGLTGWEPVAFDQVDTRAYGEPYLYGIWVAR